MERRRSSESICRCGGPRRVKFSAFLRATHGGLRWANDVIDLLLERKLNFSWHAYHEDFFGLYYGDGSLPDPGNANTPLSSVIAMDA